MKKSSSKSKVTNDIGGAIVVTIGWVIFFVISIISIILGPKIQQHTQNTKREGYEVTTLIFDHVDEENMGVYKYVVDGETYTYKEHLSSTSVPKQGDKYECYYNIDEPLDIQKADKIHNNYGEYIIIIFLCVGLVASIIDIKLGGTCFSWFVLTAFFFVSISIVTVSFFISGWHDFVYYPFLTIGILVFMFVLLLIIGWAMVATLKESIDIIQKKNKPKKK